MAVYLSGESWPSLLHRSSSKTLMSGTKASGPALDRRLNEAHRHRFDVVLVWSCDRLTRSTKVNGVVAESRRN